MVAAEALTAWRDGKHDHQAELGAVLLAEGLAYLRTIAMLLNRPR